MANKLELTWYGKDEPIRVEPRLLIENTALSNTAADPDTQNMLIHGDNLLALKALESKFAGQVKCIYIDPPYNANAANIYDDNIEHSLWLNLIRPRLQIMWSLLDDTGSIWICCVGGEPFYQTDPYDHNTNCHHILRGSETPKMFYSLFCNYSFLCDPFKLAQCWRSSLSASL